MVGTAILKHVAGGAADGTVKRKSRVIEHSLSQLGLGLIVFHTGSNRLNHLLTALLFDNPRTQQLFFSLVESAGPVYHPVLVYRHSRVGHSVFQLAQSSFAHPVGILQLASQVKEPVARRDMAVHHRPYHRELCVKRK